MKKVKTIFFLSLYFKICFCQSYQDTVFTNLFKQNGMGWNAGDGTISIALPDGKTLWMFGDSHVDQGVNSNNELPCLHNTGNSLMVQDDSNSFTTFYDTTGTNSYSNQFIKMAGDSTNIYWPAGGLVYNGVVYSFWEKYNNPFGGDFLGIVIAEIGLPNINLLSVMPLSNRSIEFGTAIISDEENGFNYIYGKENFGGLNPRPAFVARCPIGQFYSEWEFSSGDGNWVDDFSDAVPILDNVSNAYSVFRCGTKYFLLSQERGYTGCSEGREIYLYEADNPEGPFENQSIVYTIEDQFNGNYLRTYNAQVHPQFTENNELLVSYNVNKTCPHICDTMFFSETFDAELYRPKFTRIPMPTECLAVSTQNIDRSTDFKIYPSPANQFLYIEATKSVVEIEKIEIYSLLGTSIMKELFQNKIDVSGLEAGSYIVKVIAGKYELTEIFYKL